MGLPADICRLCANAGNLCVPVFGKDGDENLLRHKLRICSPIIVKEIDKFPTQVCITCLSSLDQCYEFYQLIKNAQHRLQAMIEDNNQVKRRLSDTELTEPSKRRCLGSLILTYPAGSHDLLNMKDAPLNEQKSPPLFFMINGTKSHSDDNNSIKKEEPITPTSSVSNPKGPNIQPKGAQSNARSEVTKPNDEANVVKPNESPKVAQPNTPKLMQPNTPKAAKPYASKAAQPNTLKGVKPNTPKAARPDAEAKVIQPNTPNKVVQPSASNVPPAAFSETKESKSASALETETLAKSTNVPTKISLPPVAEPKQPDVSSNESVALDEAKEPQSQEGSNAAQSPKSESNESSDPSSSEVVFKACRYCQRQFPEEALAKHESLHPQASLRVLSCVQCSRSFFSEEAYQRHVARHGRQQVPGSE